MRFAAALSTAADHHQALDEVVAPVLAELGASPDLAVCFFSSHHNEDAAGLAPGLKERTGARAVIGCSAQGVIGGGRELEDGPGLALWAARLPGVELYPFALQVVQVEEGYAVAGWPGDLPQERAVVLLLADPFTFPAEAFLDTLNRTCPGLAVVGGNASGGAGPGANPLLIGAEALPAGAVGVALAGPVTVRTLVSQGCRPVGAPYVVTRGEGNLVQELGGRPALDRVRELVAGLDARDRELARGGLQIGQVIDERKADFGPGDFLIRPVVSADLESGAIAVGDAVEVGRTLQFHVRDAAAAGEDLSLMLRQVPAWQPQGALLFTCNGRGRRFFGEPDHDITLVEKAVGGAPVAGFFAGGEFGPVGNRNFVHGYTASLAVFCPPAADR